MQAKEVQQAKAEVARLSEAFSREEKAAVSSRELCDRMGEVCRQMRQAAEEAGLRGKEAEEKVINCFTIFLAVALAGLPERVANFYINLCKQVTRERLVRFTRVLIIKS